MSTQDPSEPILIIGAGLSGLALAHALKTNSIPFRLFERDRTPLFRAQGYRIRIQDFYLKQLLPEKLWKTFENSCGEVVPGGYQLDALTGKPPEGGGQRLGPPTGQQGRGPPAPAMMEGKPMNADRRVLRNLMLAPLMEADMVQFGKKFTKYEVNEKGVLAHFSDGTREMGRLLIGADGSRSLVREQLAPDFERLDTEGRAIFGKTPIQGDLLEKIPKEIGGGLCLISDMRDKERPTKLFCDMMCFKNREKVDEDLPQDYVYWVLCLRSDGTGMDDEQFVNLTRESSRLTSMDLTMGWHESCREIINRQDPGHASTLAFATAHPDLNAWETNPKVTLIGDAAHPMTPVGGVGANAAFQDATLVLKAILDGGSHDDIATYEYAMRQNAKRYVAKSLEGASHMFGMKPVKELKPWTLWS